jgi:hypothetical protein
MGDTQEVGVPSILSMISCSKLPYGGGSSIKVIGQCQLTLETKHLINYKTFYVVEGNYGSLLGYPLDSSSLLDSMIASFVFTS